MTANFFGQICIAKRMRCKLVATSKMAKLINRISTQFVILAIFLGLNSVGSADGQDPPKLATPSPNVKRDQSMANTPNASSKTQTQENNAQEAPSKSESPESVNQEGKCTLLPVWNFNNGIRTNQNGEYNQFSAGDSTVNLNLIRNTGRGGYDRSLKISYKKSDSGFCGVWMHLYDEEQSSPEKSYLDVSQHQYISFWVKGLEGGEDFTVQMADPKWLLKEDSKPAGLVSAYLTNTVSNGWQEIVVPFEDFGLGNHKASSLTFNFTKKGDGVIYIDDINFKSSAECEAPPTKSTPKGAMEKGRLVRAMWVWNTKPLLFDKEYQADFFQFCKDHHINEVFLQVLYQFENELTQNVRCVIKHQDELRNFIKLSREREILIHALDGYPEFALEKYHPRVLAQVDALIRFNRSSSQEERYFGIHLDNEPYLLLGFETGASETILIQFLDLNRKIMALLRENNSEMVYGIDIPFWFDEAKDGNGIPKYSIKYKGSTKNVAHHLIDIVDNIGVMDYRNFAGGADGIIRHGEGELNYANLVDKKVYLGVETFKDSPMDVNFIYASPKDLHLVASRFEKFRIRVINTKLGKLIGLVQPNDLENEDSYKGALIKLYQLYGVDIDGQEKKLDELKSTARLIVENDPKYSGFELLTLKDSKGHLLAKGFKTTERMIEKITFAGKTKSEMEEVLLEVADAFIDKKSFIGFAIHYYKTYRAMPE